MLRNGWGAEPGTVLLPVPRAQLPGGSSSWFWLGICLGNATKPGNGSPRDTSHDSPRPCQMLALGSLLCLPPPPSVAESGGTVTLPSSWLTEASAPPRALSPQMATLPAVLRPLAALSPTPRLLIFREGNRSRVGEAWAATTSPGSRGEAEQKAHALWTGTVHSKPFRLSAFPGQTVVGKGGLVGVPETGTREHQARVRPKASKDSPNEEQLDYKKATKSQKPPSWEAF